MRRVKEEGNGIPMFATPSSSLLLRRRFVTTPSDRHLINIVISIRLTSPSRRNNPMNRTRILPAGPMTQHIPHVDDERSGYGRSIDPGIGSIANLKSSDGILEEDGEESVVRVGSASVAAGMEIGRVMEEAEGAHRSGAARDEVIFGYESYLIIVRGVVRCVFVQAFGKGNEQFVRQAQYLRLITKESVAKSSKGRVSGFIGPEILSEEFDAFVVLFVDTFLLCMIGSVVRFQSAIKSLFEISLDLSTGVTRNIIAIDSVRRTLLGNQVPSPVLILQILHTDSKISSIPLGRAVILSVAASGTNLPLVIHIQIEERGTRIHDGS
mmetsp:Transcript_22926/g.48423  ORF Transcript_22926/g.48423 Transcript_22926/m.48423 type:complete len:324 (-) Transcript_22926:1568-2539(-)